MYIIFLIFTIFAVDSSSCLCSLVNKDVSQTTLTIYNKKYPSGTPLAMGTIIPGTDIFVLTHAWLYNSAVQWIVFSRPNLLHRYPDANVVIIDYSPYSNNPLYVPDVCTSPYVGQAAADKLISVNADPNLISCTGHSLGAQVCGAFGRHFMMKYKRQIARITALDAAGPGFDDKNYLEMFPIMKHISKADAKRVVGIYTDSNGFGYGMNKNPGYSHISIIINEGYSQPSCNISIICPAVTIISLGKQDMLGCIFCSHRYSREIYPRAISGKSYKVTKCDNYNDYKTGKCNANPTFVFKEKLDPSITDGIYYVLVNSNFDQMEL